MSRMVTLLLVFQSVMIHNRFYLYFPCEARNCCKCKELSDLPKVIMKVNG